MRKCAGRLARRVPLWVILALAGLLVGIVTAVAAVVDWPQFQQNGQHTGILGDNANGFAAPADTTLRWSLKTGGAVRSALAVPNWTPAYRQYLLTAAAKTGDFALSVANPELFVVGDQLLVTHQATTATARVKAVNGQTLTLESALTSPFPVGAIVQITGIGEKTTVAAAAADKVVVVAHPERYVVGDTVTIGAITKVITAVTQKYGTLAFATALGAAVPAGTAVNLSGMQVTDIAYAGSDDGLLYAVDPKNGRLLWRTTADLRLGALRGTPAVDITNGRVYVTSLPGRLFAFDLHGEFRWMYPPKDEPALGPTEGSPVIDGGFVYFVADGGVKKSSGIYERAGIYKIDTALVTAEGYTPARFTLSPGELTGGVILYKKDDGNLRIVFGTHYGDPMIDRLSTQASTRDPKIIVTHPERFVPGDHVRLIDKNDPGSTQVVIVEEVDVATGTLTLDDATKTNGIYPVGSIVEPEDVVGDALQSRVDKGRVGAVDSTLTVYHADKFVVGDHVRLVHEDEATMTSQVVIVTAIDLQTNKLTVTPPLSADYPSNSALHTVNKGRIYSLDGTMGKVWMYPDDSPNVRPAVGQITATPVVDGSGFIYFGDTTVNPVGTPPSGHVYCIQEGVGNTVASRWVETVDGELVDRFYPTDHPITVSPAVTSTGEKVVFAADCAANHAGKVYAIDPTNYTVVDKCIALPDGNGAAGPLALDKDGKLLISTYQGNTYATTHANLTFGAPPWSTGSGMGFPVRTAPAVWGGLLLVGDDGGTIYGFGSTTREVSPDLMIWGPGGLWPFFHRDARHQGSLFDLFNLQEPGPQDPSLRWFAAASTLPLYSTPVVTNRTPDGRDRAYICTQEGRLFAYDAITGQLLWQYPPAAEAPLAPMLATPAVNNEGMIAVATMDSCIYLIDQFGILKQEKIVVQDKDDIRGNVVASPVFNNDGSQLYVATVDNNKRQGTFTSTGEGNVTSLTNGNLTDGIDLAKNETISYDIDIPDNSPLLMMAIAHVRLYTKSAGTLKVFNDDGATAKPIFTQQFSDVAAERWIDLNISLDAKKIVWVSEVDDASVKEFLITFAGSVAKLIIDDYLYNPDTGDKMLPAQITNAAKVEVRLSTTNPVWIKSISVQTKAAYKLFVTDLNGSEYLWKVEDAHPAAAQLEEIPIERMASKIRWERNGGTEPLSPLTMQQRYVTNVGRVFAFNTADGTLRWQYPDPDDDTQPALAAITSSPAVNSAGTVYVASKAGQLLALRDAVDIDEENDDQKAAIIWKVNNFAPIHASPVLVENAGRADLFVADAGGLMHLIMGDAGTELAGWPLKLSASFSQSAAVTANRHAYQISNNGTVYLLNLAADVKGTISSLVKDVATGVEWSPPTGIKLGPNAVTIIGRLKPHFAGVNQGQEVHFGFQNGATTYYLSVTDQQQLRVFESNDNKTPLTTVTGDVNRGIEIALTVASTSKETGNLIGYYRLPDNAGNYYGPFTEIGKVTIADAAGLTLDPYFQAFDLAGVTEYTAEVERTALYRDAAFLSTPTSHGPLTRVTTLLSMSIDSSPVIDSAGRVYVGSDAGALFCLTPGGDNILWKYTPDRSSLSTTISKMVDANAIAPVTISVASVAGLVVGDEVIISRPDGSVQDSLGRLLSISPPPNPTTALRTDGPQDDGTGILRKYTVTTTSGMAIGDHVSVQASYEGQILTYVGRISYIRDTDTEQYFYAEISGEATNDPNSPTLRFDALPAGITSHQACHIDGDPGTRYEVSAVDTEAKTVTLTGNVPAHPTKVKWIFTPAPITGMATNNEDSQVLTFTTLPHGVVEHQFCYIDGDPDRRYDVESFDVTTKTVTLTAPVRDAHLVGGTGPVRWHFARYPANSQVSVGSLVGTIVVSQAPAHWHDIGDRVSVLRGQALPMHTAPAVGPSQTVYVGADDGILYAIGPKGPSGIAPELPPLTPIETLDVSWNTFHADNQRTVAVNVPGPFTNKVRWATDTGSILESSPALGYPDETAPMGVLYVGTCDEPGLGSYNEPHGSLVAYNASSGHLRWRFDDKGKMGKIYSSPTAFTTSRTDAFGGALKDEVIVVGTVDTPQVQASTQLTGARKSDGAFVQLIFPGDAISALQVNDASAFRVGMRVFITDPESSANFEDFGTIRSVNGNQIIFEDQTTTPPILPRVAARGHVLGSRVSVQESQQGHLYCVDRAGALRWKFPAEGATAGEYIGAVRSSPVVDGEGITYFGTDDGAVYAINPDGTERWHYTVSMLDPKLATLPDAERVGIPQIVSSPALNQEGNRLYVGVSVPETNRGYLLALDTVTDEDSKRVLWISYGNDPAHRMRPLTASPTVTTVYGADRIFIGEDALKSGDADLARFFYCFDPENGAVLDRITTKIDQTRDSGAICSTAAITPESSATATGAKVAADLLTVTVDDAFGIVPGSRVRISATGFNAQVRRVTAVDNKTLTLDTVLVNNDGNWTTAAEVRLTTLEQTIIVGTMDGNLLAFAFDELRDAGTRFIPLWHYKASDAAIRTSPAVTVYEDTDNSLRKYTVFYGSNDCNVYALEFTGGVQLPLTIGAVVITSPTLLWRYYVRDRVYASPVVGMQMTKTGRALLYQASRDHYIYAFGERTGPPPIDDDDDDGGIGPLPDDDPSDDIRRPSSLEVEKTVERVTEQDPNTPGNPPAGSHWWRFTVTVRDSGQGLVDHVRLFDSLPDSLASQLPPVPVDPEGVVNYTPGVATLGFIVNENDVWKISRPITFLPIVPANRSMELNDLASVGEYTGTQKKTFWVKITSTPGGGAPDRFSWAVTTGATPAPGDWQPDAAITGLLHDLGTEGVKIQFDSTTRHTVDSRWTFIVDNTKAAWEIMWTSNKAKDTYQNNMPAANYQHLGAGFSLVEDLKDPVRQNDPNLYQRKFTFYVKVADIADRYDPAVEPDPAKRPQLTVISPAVPGKLPEVVLGGELKLDMTDFPVPNGELGLNQLTAEGITYLGSEDNPLSVVAHRETPVQSEWTDTFNVRLYYNGYADNDGKLIKFGNGEVTVNPNRWLAFSPWNQRDPDMINDADPAKRTPLFFVTETAVKIQDIRKVNGKDVGTVRIKLDPLSRNYAFASTKDPRFLTLMPYAWRVTIQQGKWRVNGLPVYSHEVATVKHEVPQVPVVDASTPDFIIANPLAVDAADHTALAVVVNTVAETYSVGIRNILADFRNNVNPVRPCWVFIDNPVQPDVTAYVTGLTTNTTPVTMSLAQPVTVEAGATVYSVTSEIQLGASYLPGHTASSPSVRIANTSRMRESQRFSISPADLLHPLPSNWNGDLTSARGYQFGAEPDAGALWDSFRYDPYRENHLLLRRLNFDLTAGTVSLDTGQSVNVHITRPVPSHQSETGSEQYRTSAGRLDTRFFIDTNSNGVWDAGESYYSIFPSGMANPVLTGNLASLDTKLGVTSAAAMRVSKPLFDMGRFAIGSGFRKIPNTASVENPGNNLLTVNRLDIWSTLQVTDGSPANGLQYWLLPTGRAGVKYNPSAGNKISLRQENDVQPLEFQIGDIGNWYVLKSPAGAEVNYYRPFAFSLLGLSYRQPTATYTGMLRVRAGDDLYFDTVLNTRVTENRISMVEGPRPAGDRRTSFDVSLLNPQPWTNYRWTNYLTGAETWPVAAELPGHAGDLGVFVSSNTPQIGGLTAAESLLPKLVTSTAGGMTTYPTDTNIWYRRVKQESIHITAINGNRFTVETGKGASIRDAASQLAGADRNVLDLIVLRNTDVEVGETPDAWYGYVASKAGDVLTLAGLPAAGWSHAAEDTVLEVHAHPWVPVIDASTMDQLRRKMADPGVANDPGPHPIRCITPSVAVNGANTWVVWSTNAVRKITRNGMVDHLPFAFLWYKQFDPENPLGGTSYWIAPSGPAAANAGTLPLTIREKPIMLPGVNGSGMVIYEGGVDSTRGLYYAYTTDALANPAVPNYAPNWTIDLPLSGINSCFSNAGNPQAWADTVGGTAYLNLVFQGRRADGNVDLYYTRLRVNANHTLEFVKTGGVETDDLVPKDGVVYTDDLGWTITGISVKTPGGATVNMVMPAAAVLQQQQFEVADAAGNYRLQVDRYRGVIRILKGTVGSVKITGIPMLQRLTTNLSADINPTVSVERYRYMNQDVNPAVPVDGNNLATQPRIWLFWTRQHADGLGSRAYYRTFRQDAGTAALTSEQRGIAGDPVKNVDMPERMLPVEILGQDGSVFIARQSDKAGLWVLSTAARSLSPSYPMIMLGGIERYLPAQQDLFLQVLNRPVPDN